MFRMKSVSIRGVTKAYRYGGILVELNFPSISNADANTLYYASDRIKGLYYPAMCHIDDGEIAASSTSEIPTSGWGSSVLVSPDDYVFIRTYSPAIYATTKTVSVTCLRWSNTFQISNAATSITLNFTPTYADFSSTVVLSNQVSNLIESRSISITGGEIVTSATNVQPQTGWGLATTIHPGDYVFVRVQSSANANTTTTATITIGGQTFLAQVMTHQNWMNWSDARGYAGTLTLPSSATINI